MGKNTDAWITGAAVCLYLVLIGWMGQIDLAWASWRKDANLAAWVQAIGSIAALAVAIWVPARQRKQEQDQRAESARQEEIRQLQQALALLGRIANEPAQQALNELERARDEYGTFDMDLADLTGAIDSLNRALLLPFPPDVVVRIGTAQRALSMLLGLARVARQSGGSLHRHPQAGQIIGNAQDAMHYAIASLQGMLRDRSQDF